MRVQATASHGRWTWVLGAGALAVASAALALATPVIAMDLFLLFGAGIVVLALDRADRPPAMLGVVAALGLYFSTGVGTVDLPVIVPLAATLWLVTELTQRRVVARPPRDLVAALGLFAIGLVLGIVRGPAGREGLRTMVILGWLLCVGRLSALLAADNRSAVLLRGYSAVAGLFGIVNVVFFVFPSLEEAYFGGWISHVFVEPDSIRKLVVGDVLNNALSPLKAATLYINANVAAMFFGTAAWVAHGNWRGSPWRWMLVVACALGAIATASRGGALGGAVSLAAWAGLQVTRARLGAVVARVAAGAVVLAGGIAALASLQSGGFNRFAWKTVSSDPRLLLWGAAVSLGSTHPVLGSGFGAWEAFWPGIARVVDLRPSFPPHNVYLYLWIIGGLTAALGFLWIAVAALRTARKLVLEKQASAVEVLAAGAVVSWCWSQATFENFFFLDYRIGFLLAVLLGGLAARGRATVAG